MENSANATVLDFNDTIFGLDDNGEIDYCKTYPILENVTIEGHCTADNFNYNVTLDEMVECRPNEGNMEIIYGDFGMDSTVVTRFNLVCKDQYKVHV